MQMHVLGPYAESEFNFQDDFQFEDTYVNNIFFVF